MSSDERWFPFLLQINWSDAPGPEYSSLSHGEVESVIRDLVANAGGRLSHFFWYFSDQKAPNVKEEHIALIVEAEGRWKRVDEPSVGWEVDTPSDIANSVERLINETGAWKVANHQRLYLTRHIKPASNGKD